MKQSISDTIISRRTSKTSLDTPISPEEIFTLLEKASYAPYHGKNEPWVAKIVTTEAEKNGYMSELLLAMNAIRLLLMSKHGNE